MNIIDAIRTLRKEKNLPYEEALNKAVEFFYKKGWPVPDSIASLYWLRNKKRLS